MLQLDTDPVNLLLSAHKLFSECTATDHGCKLAEVGEGSCASERPRAVLVHRSPSCCPALGLEDGIKFRLRLRARVLGLGRALLDRHAL